MGWILTTRSVESSRALGDRVVRVGAVETEALVAATLLLGGGLGSVGCVGGVEIVEGALAITLNRSARLLSTADPVCVIAGE